jgi:hypothetical protein
LGGAQVAETGRASRRRFASALALGVCGFVLQPVQAQRSFAPSALKAAMIQKITAFVRWPGGGSEPFVLAVLGDADLSARLRFVFDGQRVAGRPVKVLDLAGGTGLPVCDALFIGARFADTLENLLHSLTGKPVLTLGDTPGFAQRGVAVNLFVDASRRVRFEVNRASMEGAGLKPSFQLLSFATLVSAPQGAQP